MMTKILDRLKKEAEFDRMVNKKKIKDIEGKDMIGQLIEKCDPPIVVNYNPEQDQYLVYKQLRLGMEHDTFAAGTTLEEALERFIDLQGETVEFSDRQAAELTQFIGKKYMNKVRRSIEQEQEPDKHEFV